MTEVINSSLIQTLLFWGGYQWEVGGHKEKGNEGECIGCILYPYIKIEE
jgi:hypothetical protein